MPLISVVIPLYNKELHIKRALDSVLTQKIQNFEIVIIDDGSIDKGVEIVKKFTDPRIRLIQQENMGVSIARNRGIKEAKGDIIAFLDADDEWTPTFLETILRLRKNYPQAGAYATSYVFCNSKRRIETANYVGIPAAPWEGLVPNYFRSVTQGELILCSSAVAIPKRVFMDVGDFPVGIWWGEDVDMWGRIAIKYSVAFSWEVGSIYHRGSLNRACKRKLPIEEHCFIKTAHRFIDKGNLPSYVQVDLKEYIAHLEITTAMHNVFQGYTRQSLKILNRCETKRFKLKKLIWIMYSLMPPFFFNFLSRLKRSILDN